MSTDDYGPLVPAGSYLDAGPEALVITIRANCPRNDGSVIVGSTLTFTDKDAAANATIVNDDGILKLSQVDELPGSCSAYIPAGDYQLSSKNIRVSIVATYGGSGTTNVARSREYTTEDAVVDITYDGASDLCVKTAGSWARLGAPFDELYPCGAQLFGRSGSELWRYYAPGDWEKIEDIGAGVHYAGNYLQLCKRDATGAVYLFEVWTKTWTLLSNVPGSGGPNRATNAVIGAGTRLYAVQSPLEDPSTDPYKLTYTALYGYDDRGWYPLTPNWMSGWTFVASAESLFAIDPKIQKVMQCSDISRGDTIPDWKDLPALPCKTFTAILASAGGLYAAWCGSGDNGLYALTDTSWRSIDSSTKSYELSPLYAASPLGGDVFKLTRAQGQRDGIYRYDAEGWQYLGQRHAQSLAIYASADSVLSIGPNANDVAQFEVATPEPAVGKRDTEDLEYLWYIAAKTKDQAGAGYDGGFFIEGFETTENDVTGVRNTTSVFTALGPVDIAGTSLDIYTTAAKWWNQWHLESIRFWRPSSQKMYSINVDGTLDKGDPARPVRAASNQRVDGFEFKLMLDVDKFRALKLQIPATWYRTRYISFFDTKDEQLKKANFILRVRREPIDETTMSWDVTVKQRQADWLGVAATDPADLGDDEAKRKVRLKREGDVTPGKTVFSTSITSKGSYPPSTGQAQVMSELIAAMTNLDTTFPALPKLELATVPSLMLHEIEEIAIDGAVECTLTMWSYAASLKLVELSFAFSMPESGTPDLAQAKKLFDQLPDILGDWYAPESITKTQWVYANKDGG